MMKKATFIIPLILVLITISIGIAQTTTNKQIILEKDKVLDFTAIGITGFHYEDHETDIGYYRCIRSNINDNIKDIVYIKNDVLGCSQMFKGNYTESVLDGWQEEFIKNYELIEDEYIVMVKNGDITIIEKVVKP